MSLWHQTIVVPLHSTLCQEFLHAVSLVPLASPNAPTVPSDSLRAHHTSMVTLFEALAQQLCRQPKRSLRAKEDAVGAIASTTEQQQQSQPLAIDGVHAWKEMLYARDSSEYLQHYTARALDVVTMLHFLFTNCSLRPATAAAAVDSDPSTAMATSAGVAHSAPHRLLQLRVDDWLAFVRSHNQIELFEQLARVDALLEQRIPGVPRGAEGRTFLQRHYPNLALALKIMTKH
jgi:hypothetical protein